MSIPVPSVISLFALLPIVRWRVMLTGGLVFWFCIAPVLAQSDSIPLIPNQYAALMKVYNVTGSFDFATTLLATL